MKEKQEKSHKLIKKVDEELFSGFKNDGLLVEKTAENYIAILRDLCEKKELWALAQVGLTEGGSIPADIIKQAAKQGAIIVDENNGIRPDIFVGENGVRMLPVFTKPENAIFCSRHFKRFGTLAIMPITMENVIWQMRRSGAMQLVLLLI